MIKIIPGLLQKWFIYKYNLYKHLFNVYDSNNVRIGNLRDNLKGIKLLNNCYLEYHDTVLPKLFRRPKEFDKIEIYEISSELFPECDESPLEEMLDFGTYSTIRGCNIQLVEFLVPDFKEAKNDVLFSKALRRALRRDEYSILIRRTVNRIISMFRRIDSSLLLIYGKLKDGTNIISTNTDPTFFRIEEVDKRIDDMVNFISNSNSDIIDSIYDKIVELNFSYGNKFVKPFMIYENDKWKLVDPLKERLKNHV